VKPAAPGVGAAPGAMLPLPVPVGSLTAGVFNYMRQANSRPYKLANILGSAYDYIYPPLSEQDKKASVNNSLLAFMTQAPDFKQDRFKHG